MEVFNIQIRWSPGHTGIVGNEEADCLADLEAKSPSSPIGHAGYPTASGIRSVAKRLLNSARQDCWDARKIRMSTWYNQWNLPYITTKTPQELELLRPTLARLMAIRSKHGDFAWYHKKFKHDDALLQYSCGRPKTSEHIVRCRKMAASFNKWPLRPTSPPSTPKEGLEYLALLLSQPRDFEALLWLTNFYSKICTR
jgi:hypothetical protein